MEHRMLGCQSIFNTIASYVENRSKFVSAAGKFAVFDDYSRLAEE